LTLDSIAATNVPRRLWTFLYGSAPRYWINIFESRRNVTDDCTLAMNFPGFGARRDNVFKSHKFTRVNRFPIAPFFRRFRQECRFLFAAVQISRGARRSRLEIASLFRRVPISTHPKL
jgi:hypothetical protein